MSKRSHSIIAAIPTTDMWRWLVIPARNPYIYIPAPTELQAKSIANQIDAGTCPPERFIHFAVTNAIHAALELPRLPLPDLRPMPGYEAWRPVSAAAWAEASAAGVEACAELLVQRPGSEPLTLHLVAHPRGTRTDSNPAHPQINGATRA